jgi:hypothetical protein
MAPYLPSHFIGLSHDHQTNQGEQNGCRQPGKARCLILNVRQKYKTIMEYVALTFAIIAFPLAIGAYYRIDKLEKELKAKNLIANDFHSNK